MTEVKMDLPNISIIVLMNEYKEFIPVFCKNYSSIDYPQDLLEWIIFYKNNS